MGFELAREIVDPARPLPSARETSSFCTGALLPVRFSLPKTVTTLCAGGLHTALGHASLAGMWAVGDCTAVRNSSADSDHVLLVLCLNGELSIDGKDHTVLCADQMFLIKSRSYRCMKTHSPVSTLTLRFPESWLGYLAPGNVSEALFEHPVDASAGLAACGKQLLLSCWQQRHTLPNSVDRLIVETMLRFLLQSIHVFPGIDGASLSRQSHLLRIRDEISARIMDLAPVTSSILAENLGLSVRGLQAALRNCGTSVSSEVRHARMARAARLLESPINTQQSVSEVAFSVGFEELSHFSRQFKARYGMSPSEYRKSRLLSSR